jgi:hypothetical protein
MSMHGDVDQNISDLFFNTDMSDAEIKDEKNQFVDWDQNKMREEARLFLGCLERLNVAVPSVDALVEDFYKRV